MEKHTWKEFGKNKLTHSNAHYLMAIKGLIDSQGYARLSDIAKELNISKGSLSISLRPLVKKGMVSEDKNKHLSLTPLGETLAINIKNTYYVAKTFFTKILGVDAETAKIDACKIEHLLNPKITNEMIKLVKSLEEDEKTLNTIHKAMEEHTDCNIDKCRKCKGSKFCLS